MYVVAAVPIPYVMFEYNIYITIIKQIANSLSAIGFFVYTCVYAYNIIIVMYAVYNKTASGSRSDCKVQQALVKRSSYSATTIIIYCTNIIIYNVLGIHKTTNYYCIYARFGGGFIVTDVNDITLTDVYVYNIMYIYLHYNMCVNARAQ